MTSGRVGLVFSKQVVMVGLVFRKQVVTVGLVFRKQVVMVGLVFGTGGMLVTLLSLRPAPTHQANGCGIGAWETNSRIVRASSPTPGGEYVGTALVLP